MLIVMSLPSSSLRGLVTAFACRGAEAERARCWIAGVSLVRGERRLELCAGDFRACHEGARKSRYSGCCALTVLKLRAAKVSGGAWRAWRGDESVRKHCLEAFIVGDMFDVVFRGYGVSLRCLTLASRIGNAGGRRKPANPAPFRLRL